MSKDENGPRRLTYLNAWFTASGTVLDGLGDVASLEEMYLQGGL